MCYLNDGSSWVIFVCGYFYYYRDYSRLIEYKIIIKMMLIRNDIKYNLIKPFWLVVKVVMFV